MFLAGVETRHTSPDPVFSFVPVCDDFLEHPVYCGHDNKQVCHTSTSHTNIIICHHFCGQVWSIKSQIKSLQKHLASSPTLYISHWHWIQIDSDLLPQRISVGELLKRMIHHAMCVACSSISAVKRSIGSTTGCTITEKAPTRAFSWLKAATTAFTFKTLSRHYAIRR